MNRKRKSQATLKLQTLCHTRKGVKMAWLWQVGSRETQFSTLYVPENLWLGGNLAKFSLEKCVSDTIRRLL